MSTLTVADNKGGKKPQYKDYVSFLGNYRTGKKDDQCSVTTSDSGVSFSLNNSSNNSSSSINSDLDTCKNGFKEYLENYNNKKYSPVQPEFIKKQNRPAEGKTVKTEVYIEINNPPSALNQVQKVVDISNVQNSSSNVSKVSKIFEKNTANTAKTVHATSNKVNTFNFEQKDVELSNTLKRQQKKTSIGEISKKFETNYPKPASEPHKVQLKKTPSISEKSKVFEECKEIRKHSVNEVTKPFQQKEEVTVTRTNGSLSPKPPINTTKPVIAPKTFIENNSCDQKIPPPPTPAQQVTPSSTPTPTLTPPPPPPFPQNSPCNIPPPPPPPPANPPVKKFQPTTKITTNDVQNPKPDVVDGISVPVVDKNDPRVKKLVYGALREMYGAYHDKANDYLATLPKNRVRKNNGLDKIISSIAQQSQLPGTGPGFGPPQPLQSIGHIPIGRKSETQDSKMDPPQCVQNAMMTKDKKPFTYTPGGIDLSEVRSPRMARRIERNANLAGAGDVPKYQPPYPQNSGPLPPSVQAVMRPQPQVQVFPSGPPPPPSMSRGGAPPPPPPMCAPPPPPPPSGPLPTQKVMTSDNQVLERPDMTKIIPDNPMALLRKTGGPQPRKSIVDEMFAQAKAAPAQITPPTVPQYEQQQQRYQPPVDRGAPISPVPQQYEPPQPQAQYQPPRQQYQQPVPQQYQPPPQQYQAPPPQQQYQPSPPQQRSPEAVREQPRYQPPIIERQPTIPRQNNVQPEVKTSTAHLGSLYIPPASQQQQQQPQRRVVSPPSPPERNQDSPSIQTPPLKEAPRPWQGKKVQQEEVPSWAKRDNQVPTNGRQEPQNVYQSPSPPTQQQQSQQRWPQSRPVQQPQPTQPQQYNQQMPGGAPVRIVIRTNTGPAPYQPEPEERKPEAVYITQPIVLQHPGPRAPQHQRQPQNVPQPRVDSQGARVIPIQVDSNQGGRTPTTPGNDRTLNRQQSWGANPTQSKSFNIIQKLTQTDDDDEDETTPVTEHAPRYPQNFQQVPADQLRRMKLNEGDQNLMNKFKQGVDDDNYQREVDPRYRGPAIPSKAFKLLQNMTDGSPDPTLYANTTVPSGPQPQRNKGPQVRTIPVQIEGDDSPQPYVHPSEQVVPEPKKYTGSSIPSRSFKILQAMTAPDNCANVDEQYEAFPYEQWGYDPNYPPYPPPPYWHEYCYNYYYPEPGLSSEDSCETSAKTTPRATPTPTPRQTPVPFWGYAPPYPYPVPRRPTSEVESDAESNTNPRSTPLHFWGEEGYPQYPPYYDPYYYSYYYGYPPMYPPYPYYGTNETDDYAGYSSTDEMSYYNKRFSERSGRLSSLGRATPRLSVTPTLNIKEKVIINQPEIGKHEPETPSETETDSDTETYEEEENNRGLTNSPLKSIKSVNNIHVYAEEESSHSSGDEVCIEEYVEDNNEDIDDESSLYLVDDDAYPHQLSVIYEESERTDSRTRTTSALSDSTTIADRSDYEEDQSPAVVTKPFKFCVSVTEENNDELKMMVTVNDREIKTFEGNEDNITATIEIPTIIVQENTLNEDIVQPAVEEEEEEGKESDGSEDWWGILGNEDDLPPPKPIIPKKGNNEEEDKLNVVIEEDESVSNIEEDVKPIHKEARETPIEAGEKPKNNYAKASKSVYDKIEDQFEEENSGKLMEMESFVSQLEQLQKESGLWNIVLPPKTKGSVVSKSIVNKKTLDANNKTEDTIKKGSEKCDNACVNVSETNQEDSSIVDAKSDESDIDFWSTIKSEEDQLQTRRNQFSKDESNEDSSASYSNYNCSESCLEENGDQNTKQKETVPDSESNNTNEETCVGQITAETEESSDDPESSKPSDEVETNEVETEESSDEMDSSSEEEEENEAQTQKNNEEQQMKAMSIQERIQALKETIKQKQRKLQEQEAKLSVKEKISTIESTTQNRIKTTSTKSSLKSFEEYSEEEEGDSGVTSDMSRHISDTEEFPELKKLTRYQRAATHSRLFKLLQDECDNEEDEEEEEIKLNTDNTDKFSKLSVRKNVVGKEEPPRRDHLSLPLKKTNETESLSSSGINSPGSPVNDKLVNELVQSLLKRKKGQAFRNMPKEKLYAAAARILQEDMDGSDTTEDCSSFLSPLRGSTGYSTAAQTPQEFGGTYDEYKQYYETWSEAEKLYDQNYDILPSKAFKLLQEHSNLNKTGSIAGLLAKCPRVLSSKNIHKKLLKLLESPDCPSPTPENPLESNEVTSPS